MHRISKILFFVSLLVIVAGLPLIVAQAAPALPAPAVHEAAPVPSLPELVQTLMSLGGVALFFAVVANAAKDFGWVKDGQAPKVSLVLNTLGLVGLIVLQLTGRTDLVPVIDQNAGLIANALTVMLSLTYQLWVSRKGHEEVLAGMPFIGASFSKRTAGKNVSEIIGL
jgi:hypothetical protein